ncbi:ATP-binding protein [Skermanella rosea]|uniref:ATP-binding protein n=1 Tax=Skermanella rosea TaxID=1817965 RepID=UPI0019319D2F|nr:ATP-binding protein [Skermanella rosea]UEM05660.1 ATP-binding protein [Skermanella rosea]
MSSITSAGPEGYEHQHLATVWVALMLWRHADLRVLPEEGEDFRIECGILPDGNIDIQVKQTPQPFTMQRLADILSRFGDRQARSCTFNRLLDCQRILVIVGGSCQSDTERYRCNTGEFDAKPAVSPEAARGIMSALSAAGTQVKNDSYLDIARRKQLASFSNLMVSQVQEALRRVSVWDRIDEPFIRQRCIDMVTRLRIPVDQAENIVKKLVAASREAAKDKADVMPTLRGIIEDCRIDRYCGRDHIVRADEQTFFERLCRDYAILLSGPPRCGKTEMARALLDCAADKGYFTNIFDNSQEARQFLSQGSRGHRACLLDDPLGTRGVVKDQGQGMRELRAAVDATGPGRFLIIAQSRDELLSASSADTLDQCRLPKAPWQTLNEYPAGFLSQVWASLRRERHLLDAKSDAVDSLLANDVQVEVGALELVAANLDFLPDAPTQDDLWRVFHQEASDLIHYLVHRRGEDVGDLMLILAITTTPRLSVNEREIAFILSDDKYLPGQGSIFRMTISFGKNGYENLEPPKYDSPPYLDHATIRLLDDLEQRRLINVSGCDLQFRHSYYRAAGEWWGKGIGRRRAMIILWWVRRGMFSASPRTSRATAFNLPVLFNMLRDEAMRINLLDLAADGLGCRYPATRDLCHRFLLSNQNALSSNARDMLQGSGIYDDRLFSFEWLGGEAWRPDQWSFGSYVHGEIEDIQPESVNRVLGCLAAGIEAAPASQDAAHAILHLARYPMRLTAAMMENLLSYDLSAIRAEAADVWLKVERTEDAHIRDRIFSDPAPVVAHRSFRSVARAWSSYSEDRRKLLAKDIGNAAGSTFLSANAFMQTMSKFDRPHDFMANPPWDLFAQTLPAAMRGLGETQTFDTTSLWATIYNDALPHLSCHDIVSICTAWSEVLLGWSDNTFRDYDFSGIVPVLVKGTDSEPELRAELSQLLLRAMNTPLQIVLLKDYLEQWDLLTQAERNIISDRLTGNHPEKIWYQAIALTRDRVPPEVQEWITGDPAILKLSPKELRAQLDTELFTTCVQVYSGQLYPLPSLGVRRNGRDVWCPVMELLRGSPHDRHFLLALEEALGRRDDAAVRASLQVAEDAQLQKLFEIMLAHEIDYSGGWMPNAWDALLTRANKPDVRKQWLDKMAEAAPAIIDGIDEARYWLINKEFREEFLGNFLSDHALLIFMDILDQMSKQDGEEFFDIIKACERFIGVQAPRLIHTFTILEHELARFGAAAEPLLSNLETLRRKAVSEANRIREEGRPALRFVQDWTRPSMLDGAI